MDTPLPHERGPVPLIVADGDIPTTHIVARCLRAAFGAADVRYASDLFGTPVHGRPLLFSRFCYPAHGWLPDYLRQAGTPYVYFLDDNFWELTEEIDPHLVGFFGHPAVQRTLDSYIEGARACAVMSRRLGQYIAQRLPAARIEFIPPPFDVARANALLATPPGPRADADCVRIGYPSSRRPSVTPLLVPVVRHLAAKYRERVRFEFIGWVPDELAAAERVAYFPPIASYDDYLQFKISRRWDIGIAPLVGGVFEACKTNLKYREYGGCRIAGVYSRVSPYLESVEEGRTGVLADNTADAWIDALERLIESAPLRERIAAAAHEDVGTHYHQDRTAARFKAVLLDRKDDS